MSNEKLTPAQEAKIPEYREKFLKMGLNTEPANKEKSEEAVKNYYRDVLRLKEPYIIWADSLLAGAILAAKASKYTKGKTAFVESELRQVEISNQDVRDQAHRAAYGSLEAYYVAFYSFVQNEVKPAKFDPTVPFVEALCENCGAYWLFEGLAILTDRPSEIHFDGEMLHCETGPAIAYRDGYGVYCYKNDVKADLAEVVLAAKLEK